MTTRPDAHIDTWLAHAGTQAHSTGHVTPPIAMSSTFARNEALELMLGIDYGRDGAPAYKAVEAALCRLERGASALVFASGMAAATSVFSSLRHGDHAVLPRAMYWGLRRWVQRFSASWGLEVDFVETWNPGQLEAALRPGQTKLVWIETPANPTWEVTDIARAAEATHHIGAALCVDSTAASPLISQPLSLGADLVMHSASKYLNGHSDVIAGALVARTGSELWERIKLHRNGAGAVLGPFESWLLLRGLRTLSLRVERASQTALALADWLEAQPAIHTVRYPGLPSHPQHEVAKRQMTHGFGGMLSVQVRGGQAAALAVLPRLEVFLRATSLGGTESLIEHRATAEGPGSIAPDDLLRISVGLEHVEDLKRDLEQALSAVSRGAEAGS